jgi:hypothetical protein
MGRGRKTGDKLGDKHKQNIATARRQIEQEKRNKNLNSFKRSLFAQVEAVPEETGKPSATSEEEEKIASASDTIDLVHQEEEPQPAVQITRTHEPQQIVPNLDVLDDEDFHNDDDIADGDPALADDAANDGGVMHKFLQAIQKRLQDELSYNFPALNAKWLLEYLKDHDWWIRQYNCQRICKKLNINFDENQYMKERANFWDVYVWLPDERWGTECMPSCCRCGSNERVRNNGFRNNHFGRRIIGLKSSYYCLSRRYRCQACEDGVKEVRRSLEATAEEHFLNYSFEDGRAENQYTFMAWHRRTLELYPYGRGHEFQSHVGGVRISCHPEVVRGSYKGWGKRGSGIAHFASTVGSVT